MSNKMMSNHQELQWQRNFRIHNFSVEVQSSSHDMNTLGLAPSIISGWPNYIITIDTEEAEPIMRCLKEAAEEEELRNCHPSVLEAWLKYRTLLDLVK